MLGIISSFAVFGLFFNISRCFQRELASKLVWGLVRAPKEGLWHLGVLGYALTVPEQWASDRAMLEWARFGGRCVWMENWTAFWIKFAWGLRPGWAWQMLGEILWEGWENSTSPHHLMLAQCSAGFALGKWSSSLGFFFRKQEDIGSVVSHLIRPPVILVMCLAPRAVLHLFLLCLTVACDTCNYPYL